MIQPVILYEDEFLICAVKPDGIPTQPDKTGDMDMVTILTYYLKEKKYQNPYIGLIHRLDRPVGGILLFSKNKDIDYKLAKMLQENKIKIIGMNNNQKNSKPFGCNPIINSISYNI